MAPLVSCTRIKVYSILSFIDGDYLFPGAFLSQLQGSLPCHFYFPQWTKKIPLSNHYLSTDNHLRLPHSPLTIAGNHLPFCHWSISHGYATLWTWGWTSLLDWVQRVCLRLRREFSLVSPELSLDDNSLAEESVGLFSSSSVVGGFLPHSFAHSLNIALWTLRCSSSLHNRASSLPCDSVWRTLASHSSTELNITVGHWSKSRQVNHMTSSN